MLPYILRPQLALYQFLCYCVFVMAEKQGNSACHETRSCSARFPHLVSFTSALICITVLVRVEIVNKRVDTIENLFAEVRIPKTDRERSEKRIEKRDTAAFGLGRKRERFTSQRCGDRLVKRLDCSRAGRNMYVIPPSCVIMILNSLMNCFGLWN